MSNRNGDDWAIARQSGQPLDRVRFALDRLTEKGLAAQKTKNYILYAAGFDILALKYYADHQSVSSLGKIIAKGKESDVYEVLTDGGELLALKFFRLGRTSFRGVTRRRFTGTRESYNWASKNYQSAKREFKALKKLEGISEHIPGVISFIRHTLLLEEVLGVRLANRPELHDASGMLKEILRTMRKIYIKASMISADLSEYNVLTEGSRFWFIDWPQAVSAAHPNARMLLSRDVGAIVNFFRRGYGLSADGKEAVDYVLGAIKEPKIRRV
jgi:RIO kinase 2